ncbi:MAG: PLP-dependent transferase [Candidatus Marinimicrobia bacterium]|nr:PLP-dependent transferase [Candidatus Neomarinimicrobiota bacterium]
MKFETKIVRGNYKPDPTTGAIIPPLYQTSTYVLEQVGKDKGFDYTRSANPTRQLMEEHIAIIEEGKFCVAFSSGMATVDSCMKLLKSGDHIICSDDVYGGVSRHFNELMTNYNITFTYVDSHISQNIEDAIQSNTKMIWVETPTNPLLKITDLKKVRKIARKNDLLFAVDSTFATPIFLKPLEFGADLVIHSTTKYLSGHNQLIGGVVITNDGKLFNKLKFIQKTVGAVPSPFDCWLTILGIKTLSLRMKKHSQNAQILAKFLANHQKVSRVIYPGLKSDEGYSIASEQMTGFSGMISFELKGDISSGKKIMNSVTLCQLAESLGSVDTMITHPASMTHADVPKKDREKRGLTDGLVRISVGIEHIDDIIGDLEQALEKV